MGAATCEFFRGTVYRLAAGNGAWRNIGVESESLG